MSIAVKKSGSWVAGQGFKLTGTGPGMKAGNVAGGGGGGPTGSGSAADPYVISPSASIFSFAIDSSVESVLQAGQYARLFKVTVPAGTTLHVDTTGDDATGLLIVRSWMGAPDPSSVSGYGGTASMANGGSDASFTWMSRGTLDNSAGAGSQTCIFEIAAVVPSTYTTVQVRVS